MTEYIALNDSDSLYCIKRKINEALTDYENASVYNDIYEYAYVQGLLSGLFLTARPNDSDAYVLYHRGYAWLNRITDIKAKKIKND